MIDLCKLFGVEEGEEFKLYKKAYKFKITNNKILINYYDNEESWMTCTYGLNFFTDLEVIKLPKEKEFTDDELCILTNVDKKYKWIGRDADGELYLYKEKPRKSLGFWESKSIKTTEFLCYNHLFQSIQWEDEEPVFIDDYVERGAE